ncbi:unnamed protein product, partial [Mesorhabditis belari]|uniref:CUB domain-containing protein n=1 Tax=Mesorhabditis belari TaxID=2138241 RepID=A0AAF3FJP2_9BILA
MYFILIFFYINSIYSATCFNETNESFLTLKHDSLILKNPEHPRYQDLEANCTWVIYPKANHILTINVRDVDLSSKHDYIKIEELVSINETEYQIPMAYINKQSVEDNDGTSELIFLYARALRIKLSHLEGFLRFHFMIRQQEENHLMDSCPKDVVIFASDESKMISTELKYSSSIEECQLLLVAPNGKSIELNTTGSWKYLFNDIAHLDRIKKISSCSESNESSLLTSFQTYSNQALLQICLNHNEDSMAYNFTVTAVNDRCTCEEHQLQLTSNQPISFLPTIFPSGTCQDLFCYLSLSTNVSVNSTHYPRVIARLKPLPVSLPVVHINLTTFSIVIQTQDISTRQADETPRVLPPVFSVHYKAMEVFEFRLMSYPKECKCFPESEQFLIFNQPLNTSQRIQFNISESCELLNCWIKIKNDPQKSLTILKEPHHLQGHWTLAILLDDHVEISLDDQFESRYEFSSDDFLEYVNQTQYIYVLFTTKPVPFKNLNIEMNLTIDWAEKKNCECGQRDHTIEDEPIFLVSPNFPQRYCNKMNCQYFVDGPLDVTIQYEVIEFEMEDSDLLFISNLEEDIDVQEIRHAGQKNTSTSTFHIMFRTDGTDTFRGYKIKFWPIHQKRFNVLPILIVCLILVAVLAGVLFYKKQSNRRRRTLMVIPYNDDVER